MDAFSIKMTACEPHIDRIRHFFTLNTKLCWLHDDGKFFVDSFLVGLVDEYFVCAKLVKGKLYVLYAGGIRVFRIEKVEGFYELVPHKSIDARQKDLNQKVHLDWRWTEKPISQSFFKQTFMDMCICEDTERVFVLVLKQYMDKDWIPFVRVFDGEKEAEMQIRPIDKNFGAKSDTMVVNGNTLFVYEGFTTQRIDFTIT